MQNKLLVNAKPLI